MQVELLGFALDARNSLFEDHPEVTAWVALDDLDFDWADALRQAGPGSSFRAKQRPCEVRAVRNSEKRMDVIMAYHDLCMYSFFGDCITFNAYVR